MARQYYEALRKKYRLLKVKRVFDIGLAWALLALLAPIMALVAAAIYLDSGRPVFYRQLRVTQYGRRFWICKFRTMVPGADRLGAAVAKAGDARVTKVGLFLRKTRLDELPQLFNIIAGDMAFVGARPEVPAFVKKYTPEMWATLLLPAGVTSAASIRFKDEGELLKDVEDVDAAYLEKVLPRKMEWNLQYVKEFSLWEDLKIIARTAGAVLQ